MSKPKTIYYVETSFIDYIVDSNSIIDKKTFESKEDAKKYADKQIEKCKAEAKEEFTVPFTFATFVNGGGYLEDENGEYEYAICVEKTELVPDSKKKPPKHVYVLERADGVVTKLEYKTYNSVNYYESSDGLTAIFPNSEENKSRPWNKEKYGRSKTVFDTRGALHKIYTNPAMLIK